MERADNDRVLLSYDLAGRTKVAFVAADGIRDWHDDVGWGVEAWAQCDPAEFPPNLTDALDISVWEDETGRRVPVSRIQTFMGAEHCGWQDITFLLLRPEGAAHEYVRDPKGELGRWLSAPYDG